MIQLRKAHERGHGQHGWLDSRHTFSFAGYQDPQHQGFRALRVINEDRIAPGKGFGLHGHRDMEIVTYVLSGAVRHEDNIGNGAVLPAGNFQYMAAGTGVQHAEYNASKEEPVHLYQIWVHPDRPGHAPDYAEHAPPAEFDGGFHVVVSGAGEEGGMRWNQDAALALLRLEADAEAVWPIAPERHVWIQATRGALEVNGMRLEAGDGAAISGETEARVRAVNAAEALLFDLA